MSFIVEEHDKVYVSNESDCRQCRLTFKTSKPNYRNLTNRKKKIGYNNNRENSANGSVNDI